MKRRNLFIGGLCLAVLGLTSCGGGSDGGGTSAQEGFKVELEMQATNGSHTNSFSLGDTIVFALTITNRSGGTQALDLPTAQIYDLAVLDPGSQTPRWRWSFNQTFAPTGTHLSFAGHQSITYLFLWNGVLEDGTQIMPGSYDFRGTLAYSGYAADWRNNDDRAAHIQSVTITN